MNGMEIRKIKDYIESNLDSHLKQNQISDYGNYSKFHFHRLFLSSVGNTVMSYVNIRRIRRSRFDLIAGDTKLLDIAFNCGFSNYDTYTRSFKKLYGITPQEYRRIYGIMNSKRDTKELFLMRERLWIEKLQECDYDAKKHGLETIGQIIELSELAHKNGLFALGNVSLSILNSSKFFKIGLDLLLDGTDPAMLRSILENYILVGNYQGNVLIEQIFLMEGLLEIQNGSYPWEIKNYLSSLLGIEFHDEVTNFFGDDEASKEALSSYLGSVEDDYSTSKDVLKFEKTILGIDSRSMQRLLREVDLVILCRAIEKVGKSVQNAVLEGLPSRKIKNMVNVYKIHNNMNLAETLDAQNEVLKIIMELRRANDIL